VVTPASVLARPDPVTFWLKLDLLTRRVVGRRMEEDPTAETDEALDRLIALRATVTRRIVN
jgi:hypothetical protein